METQSKTTLQDSSPSAGSTGRDSGGEDDRLRDALRQIGSIIDKVIEDDFSAPTESSGLETDTTALSSECRIMPLPSRLQDQGAELAKQINPVNAPLEQLISFDGGISQPQFVTLLTTKYWGPLPKTLSVSFMETTPSDLKARILSHFNAWSCGITFALTSGTGNIRISRGSGGYWSYLGTDTKLIPANRPTMNLEGFTMNTADSEYKRVVRHEVGHTLGFPHEHMRKSLVARIDRQKAYAYFARQYGWSREMVDQQVLTPLDARTIIGTEADQDSIMCYQLPGEITKDGAPINGGTDINQSDRAFAQLIFPTVLRSPDSAGTDAPTTIDWDPSEDVSITG
jgi:hypothetical protein